MVGGPVGGLFAAFNDIVMGREVSAKSVLLGIASGAINGAIGISGIKIGVKVAVSAFSSGVATYLSSNSVGESLIAAGTAAVTAVVSEPVCKFASGIGNASGITDLCKAKLGGMVSLCFETHATIVKKVTVRSNQQTARPDKPKATVNSSYIPKSSGAYSGHSGGGRYTNKQMSY